MLTRLFLAGYRSIRDLQLGLAGVDVVVGPNGCGKSNLYRALWLLAQSAQGRLSRALADEGGLPSALSATATGPRCTAIELGCRIDDWHYELAITLPAMSKKERDRTAFGLDPEIRAERLSFHGGGKSPVVFLDRKDGRVMVRDADGRCVDHPASVLRSESALSQLRDPVQHPELAALRGTLAEWRFYHQFRVDEGSPMRRVQVGVFTPVLAHDGSDLAAALQTIREHRAGDELGERFGSAFPGAELSVAVDGPRARFEVTMQVPDLARPLRACELSDGTLRYLCLLAALLSPRPPELMVLNEPETSLHPRLLPALADLVVAAGRRGQVLLTTHSRELAEAIAAATKKAPIELQIVAGATVAPGRGRFE